MCSASRKARPFTCPFCVSSIPVHDMAIDLGTANTVVYVRAAGSSQRAVGGRDRDDHGVKRVKAVGDDAKLMMADARQIEAIRPLRDGVLADIDVAEQMIKYFIQKVHGKRAFPAGPIS